MCNRKSWPEYQLAKLKAPRTKRINWYESRWFCRLPPKLLTLWAPRSVFVRPVDNPVMARDDFRLKKKKVIIRFITFKIKYHKDVFKTLIHNR